MCHIHLPFWHLTTTLMVWTLSPLLSDVRCAPYWHRQTASCLFVVSGSLAYSSNLKYFFGQCYKPRSTGRIWKNAFRVLLDQPMRDGLSCGPLGVTPLNQPAASSWGAPDKENYSWVDIFKIVTGSFLSVGSSCLQNGFVVLI